MCVVSMIGDYYKDKWQDRPWWPNVPATIPYAYTLPLEVTRVEFEALKREVEELKELLKRAKEYDARTGQPDCEIDEKMELLRRVALAVGVDLDEVLGKERGDGRSAE